MKIASRKFDVIIWGSTGYTGKLVCEYIHKNYPLLKWAMAGRNKAKISQVKAELNIGDEIPILIGDIQDSNSIDEIVRSTKAMLSTAGPFALVGTEIVASCIRCSTNYADTTGETQWVKEMIQKYHKDAVEKSIKIVNCCGVDCIPSDLGSQLIHEKLTSANYHCQEIRFTVDEAKGGVSGGTIASVANILDNSSMSELKQMSNPYFLIPDSSNPVDTLQMSKASDGFWCAYDKIEKCWTIPYVMQVADTRIVNRSLALSEIKNSDKIVYTERMKVPNVLVAVVASIALLFGQIAMLIPISRYFIRLLSPKPGQGPSKEFREAGYMKVKLWGRGVNDKGDEMIVRGGMTAMNGDPGYVQTAKFVAESAICLALDVDRLPKTYGVITSRIAMGSMLRKRLEDKNVEFYILDK